MQRLINDIFIEYLRRIIITSRKVKYPFILLSVDVFFVVVDIVLCPVTLNPYKLKNHEPHKEINDSRVAGRSFV
jgi:hypothetical protein